MAGDISGKIFKFLNGKFSLCITNYAGSPGRFFVSVEMKAMLAYILFNYDMKMEQEGVRPEDEWFGTACAPNTHAKVLFRRRM